MLRYLLWGEPEKPVNQNKAKIRKVKKIANEGDLNMAANSGVTCEYEDTNQQPPNPFAQADWGVNEPVIEECEEITGKGKINMGTNSGVTMKGKRAPKSG